MLPGFHCYYTLARALVAKNHLREACRLLDHFARPELYSVYQLRSAVGDAMRTLGVVGRRGPLAFAGDTGDEDNAEMRRRGETPESVTRRLVGLGVDFARVEPGMRQLLVTLCVDAGVPLMAPLIQHLLTRQNTGRVVTFELLSRDTSEL
jgi:hypothetical protein